MYIPKEIHARLVLDISELGFVVEDILEDLVGRYEKGLYLPNQREPLFYESKKYYVIKYTDSDEIYKEEITDFFKVKGTIVDENDESIVTIITPEQLREVLTDKPTQAYNGIDFIKDYVYMYIFNLVQWGEFPKKNIWDLLHQLMTNQNLTFSNEKEGEYIIDVLEDKLNCKLIELRTDIHDFMNKDYMNMYDIEVKHTHLHITKMQDYRIYEYEKIKRTLVNGEGM